MNTKPTLKSLVALVAALSALAGTWPSAHAQTSDDAKVRLMAGALRAREAGDLESAKTQLEELLALTPDDAAVRRLLDGVNQSLAARTAAATSVAAPAPVATPPPAVVAPDPVPVVAAAAPVEEPTPEPAAPVRAASSGDSPVEAEAEMIARSEKERIADAIKRAKSGMKEAHRLAKDGQIEAAKSELDRVSAAVPLNPLTQKTFAELQQTRHEIYLDYAQFLLAEGNADGAREAIATYADKSQEFNRRANRLSNDVNTLEVNPPLPFIEEASPTFVPEKKAIAQLAAQGRAQYLAGDIDGAQETYRKVEAVDPDNAESKSFLRRIAEEKAAVGALNRQKARAQMLEEVAKSWQRPAIYQERSREDEAAARVTPLLQKLNSIQIPSTNFTGVELSRVVNTLSQLSIEADPSSIEPRGVNIVVIDPSGANPQVNITLRNLTLKRTLDFITEQVGYQYEVLEDAVVIRPGGERTQLETEFFPVTRSTVIRMTGVGSAAAAATPAANDPFAAPSTGGGTGTGGASGEAASLKAFLQQAGVNFEGVPESSLAYDGSAMIVTQTARNIERIRNILNRYNDVRQVEIEAKFMEVQEGALEELGVNWTANGRGSPTFNPSTGAPILNADGTPLLDYRETYRSPIRGLNDAFKGTQGTSAVTIDGQAIGSSGIPALPGVVALGDGAAALGAIEGVIGAFDVTATIRALSQKQGSELLSAPKVTVLSGNPATITVAQELSYPTEYGEPQSQVGTGGAAGTTGTSAGVTITPGTPQEFATRNVGVELTVTPTVEEDDYSISLDLHPRVTEFEGFVEYGGTAVAISGGTTVTVPPGFFQPIFSVRDITTKVTIWDGATLVMGGLTREEVRRVDDKIPILGDIPFFGRAFRSKGESSQKRNLLIFVTANLVSPGGSPKKQALRGVAPSTTFQNPTIVTPASAESRAKAGKK